MNKKILLIFMLITTIGFVSANATITNFEIISSFSDFVAGERTSATFQFDYPGDFDNNYNDAPLVAIVNITSLNENFPVWKGDFSLSMIARQYFIPTIFGDLFLINEIPLTCSEDAPITFKVKDKSDVQYSISEITAGSFYCYNANYFMLQLDSQDVITLNITSNIALFPGEYEIGIGLFEMEPDFDGPEIELVSPTGEEVFSEINEIIEIKLNITDLYNIDKSSIRYKIVTLGLPSDGEEIGNNNFDSGWIDDIHFNEISGFYEGAFNITEQGLNASGEYWIFSEAKDVLGNKGNL